jgi:hypothetical protein
MTPVSLHILLPSALRALRVLGEEIKKMEKLVQIIWG